MVVLPECDPTLGGELELLRLELAGFEAELGAPVEFSPRDPGRGARWLLRLVHDHEGPATVEVDPTTRTIASSPADVAGLFESMNLLRTAVRLGQRSAATDCSDVDEAISWVVEEVADTYRRSTSGGSTGPRSADGTKRVRRDRLARSCRRAPALSRAHRRATVARRPGRRRPGTDGNLAERRTRDMARNRFGMTLTASTALTYDRDGHCVEGAGIPVDVAAGGSDGNVLALAETL